MAGIYLHIPFCKQACYYCDFHFSTSLQYIEEVVDAMVAEIKIQKNYLDGERIQTIYFGGGTPSLVGAQHLGRLLETVQHLHTVAANAEVTVEANPDDLLGCTAGELHALGANRLSIGIQSFHERHLRLLHRVHTARESFRAFETARRAGFGNINADLIFGIPGSSVQQVQEDLRQLVQLGPEHISAYALTIEPQTVFGNWTRKGKLQVPKEEIAAEQFCETMNFLRSADYRHYEISNYAQSGYRSHHNLAYWQHTRYLGIGPGAHSFDGNRRQYNIANNHLYRRSISAGKVPATVEQLTRKQRANEYMMLSLRTSEGCDLLKLGREYGMPLSDTQRQRVLEFIEQGFVERRENHLVCTDRGKLLADELTVALCFD